MKKKENVEITSVNKHPLERAGFFVRLRALVPYFLTKNNINIYDLNGVYLGTYNSFDWMPKMDMYDDCKVSHIKVDWDNKCINIFIDPNIKRKPWSEEDFPMENLMSYSYSNNTTFGMTGNNLSEWQKGCVEICNELSINIVLNLFALGREKIIIFKYEYEPLDKQVPEPYQNDKNYCFDKFDIKWDSKEIRCFENDWDC